MRVNQKVSFIFAVIIALIAWDVYSARIKDIAMIEGVRDNQLIGYGLVVGLDGTGDKQNQAPFTDQTFANMLLNFGIRLPVGRAQQLKNVAAVAISANLPPFARIGQKLDLTISSLGNAISLRGGNLLMAELRGADGKVYAIAQGNVVVSGFGAQGSDGSKVVVNSIATGSIPNGATVEATIDTPFVKRGILTFQLNQADFTTAFRVEDAINKLVGRKIAKAMDGSAIQVRLGRYDPVRGTFYKGEEPPVTITMADPNRAKYVEMISKLENIDLQPGEVRAKVIVNSRTGTIVIGHNVTIAPVAVSHGNLSVVITERPYVSQPQGFSNGTTVQGSASQINVNQQKNRAFVFAPGPTLNDLVEAVNLVGAAPGDLISILEAIKASGSLNADLEVI